jgi:hypothetical protein
MKHQFVLVCFLRVLLLLSVTLALVAVPPGTARAAPPLPQQPPPAAWFGSHQPIVAPLQPVNISVTSSAHQGPATLVVFDSVGRSVGSWEFFMPPEGRTNVQVVPRGALGEHWAVLFVNGEQVASGTIYRLDAQTTVQTNAEPFEALYLQMADFLGHSVLEYALDGHMVHGYRSPDSPLIWLRDHYYQGRGFKYLEPDVTSVLAAFRRAQAPDGHFPDFLTRPSYNIPAMRTPVEADVEYLFVLAVYDAWKMTGDDAWMQGYLPSMTRALSYTLTDAQRWEPALGLVKRPFTIDTWDFEYGPTTIDPNTGEPAPRHWIDDQTIWGIFHGDNTGLAAALNALAHMEERLGFWSDAARHRQQAEGIMQRLNALSWNGAFYTHHVTLQPFDVPGVDEATQLSLSNAYALNRNVLSNEQARAIIQEYRSRLMRPGNLSFAEWWSIDPPFPQGAFGMAGRLGEKPGYYVNGGIMPLVGGELARGAFRYGFEAYGFDILHRYYDLVSTTGASYLWYHPTGGPGAMGSEVLATDGWGSSAMLAALMEGAAGVEDNGTRYSHVTLSPRWPAASDAGDYAYISDVTSAYVVARYAASDGYVAYRWNYQKLGGRSILSLEATGSGESVTVRLLLPAETLAVERVTVNGDPVDYTYTTMGSSRYLTLAALPNGIIQVEAELTP